MSRNLDHLDGPESDWRDDAPKLAQCDGDRCTEYETEDVPFFVCGDCTESLCPDHAGTTKAWADGVTRCERCGVDYLDKCGEFSVGKGY